MIMVFMGIVDMRGDVNECKSWWRGQPWGGGHTLRDWSQGLNRANVCRFWVIKCLSE